MVIWKSYDLYHKFLLISLDSKSLAEKDSIISYINIIMYAKTKK